MGQRVLAASLKPALQVAAAKQVAACGMTVESAQVSFTGKGAYAVWDEVRWGSRHHRRSFRVNYPALADDAVLTRVEADLISAYTLHETGHVLFTANYNDEINRLCGDGGVRRDIAHPIGNGLEDGRMENAVISHGIARNARYMFGRLLNKLTHDMPAGWNPCDFIHSAFTCALLSREVYGNGNAFTRNLLDRIPEPKRSLYAWVMDQCRWAPKGFDEEFWAYKTAIEFVQRWRVIEESKPKPVTLPPPPPPPPGEEEEEDWSEEEEPEEGEDDFEDRDEATEPEDDPGQPDDGEQGGFNDPWGGEKEEEEEEEEEEDEEASGPGDDKENEGDDEGGGKAGDEDGESDGDEGEESDGAGAGDHFDFNDKSTSGHEQPAAAEPNVDEIFKRANKRAEGSSKSALPSIIAAPFEDPLRFIQDQIKHGRINEGEYVPSYEEE